MKKAFVIFVLSALLCSTVPQAYAGKIADTFKNGVFGIPWQTSLSEIQGKFPNGELENTVGTNIYKIKDGREIFEIERDDENEIHFYFNSDNKLNSIMIEFPSREISDFGSLFNKLETYFPTTERGENKYIGDGVFISWPEDGNISLSLLNTAGTVFTKSKNFMGIHYKPTQTHNITKEQMGLD